MTVRILDDEVSRTTLYAPGTAPDYDHGNPILGLIEEVEAMPLAAEREHYLADSLQYLMPIRSLAFHGPAGADRERRDPRQQDDRNDFQKQNLREFSLSDTRLVRGYAVLGDWIGSFLGVSYVPGPGSPLLSGDGTYDARTVLLYLKVGGFGMPEPIVVPFDPVTQGFRVELWGVDRPELLDHLGEKGKAAVASSALVPRPDLVRGTYDELLGQGFDRTRREAAASGAGVEMLDFRPDHTMHPIRPLRIEFAWGSADGSRWDSSDGANHAVEFDMSLRGWRNYLAVGKSRNPHGGLKGLEYRNLYSNYFGYEEARHRAFGGNVLPELGRDLPEWSLDANGNKPPLIRREPFMAVDYMDLHILEPNSVIGLHRHRDNQEAFSIIEGKALMVVADWVQRDDRERAFEVRTMRAGDLVLIKGGQMHALINCLDEKVLLFMFGGYD